MSKSNKAIQIVSLITAVLVVIALGIVWFMRDLDTFPNIAIPKRNMPSPNGYDYFVKACVLIKPKNYFTLRFASDPANSIPGKEQGEGESNRYYPLAEREEILRKNTAVLKIAREGFQFECKSPRLNSNVQYSEEIRPLIKLGFLLSLDAQVKAVHNDWNGAINSCMDAIEIGEDLSRDGGTGYMYTGISVERIGRQESFDYAKQLGAKQAKAACKRLEAILAKHAPFTSIIEEQKWTTISVLKSEFSKPDWRKNLFFDCPGDNPWGSVEDSIFSARWFTTKQKTVVYDWIHFCDEWKKYAKKPYALKSPLPAHPANPMSAMLTSIFSFELERFEYLTRAQISNEQLLVALALQAYKAESGYYPKSIQELVPRYLEKLPDDSFAFKGTYKYYRNGADYVLYSVGPDGIDDGGKPAYDHSPGLPGHYYWLDPDSKGDFVAGVNL